MLCCRRKLARIAWWLLIFTVAVLFLSLLKFPVVGTKSHAGSSTGARRRLPEGRSRKRAGLQDAGIEPFLDEANFTIVIQTYKRNDLLYKLLTHYCMFEAVDRIIVVWNNVNVSVPDFLHYMPCGPQLFYLKQTENTIRNRFQPFSQIRTEGAVTRAC